MNKRSDFKVQIARARKYQAKLEDNLNKAETAARRLRMTRLNPAQKGIVDRIIGYLQNIE